MNEQDGKTAIRRATWALIVTLTACSTPPCPLPCEIKVFRWQPEKMQVEPVELVPFQLGVEECVG